MRKKRSLWSSVAVLGVGSTAFGAAYTWTGDGDGSSWDGPSNWTYTGVCSSMPCYPKDTGDNATIDILDAIALVDDTIGDLTMGPAVVTLGGGNTLIVDQIFAGDPDDLSKFTLVQEAVLTNITP